MSFNQTPTSTRTQDFLPGLPIPEHFAKRVSITLGVQPQGGVISCIPQEKSSVRHGGQKDLFS